MSRIRALMLAAPAFLIQPALGQVAPVELVRDESSVTYRITHPLHVVEATSKDVLYAVAIDTTARAITSVSAHVDVMTFDSGNSNRDSHAMEVIDALSYPEAEFHSTAITRQGDSLRVTGTLTFHGVTKEIHALMAAAWGERTVTVTGGFDVSLTEFKIDRPSLLMIPVDDTLRFLLKAVFRWQ